MPSKDRTTVLINATTFHDIVSGRRRDPIAIALRLVFALIELPYRVAVAVRNRRFDRQKLSVTRVDAPVISVGNLTLGGTGKTPVVAWLARWFRDRDIRVSIISRGYGSNDSGQNDEARELEARLPDVPHLQNPDRVAAATVAIEELETELILLDDGFQHRRLHRDLNILLVDATDPFGHDRVFPRGTLREPLQSSRRADVIAVTKCEAISSDRLDEIDRRFHSIAPNAVYVRLKQLPTNLITCSGIAESIELLRGKRVAAFCGIGNPDSFRTTLQTLGADLVAFREFPDHHKFKRSDIQSISECLLGANIDLCICTHKDLVKLNVDRIASVPLYALQIQLEIASGQELFEQRLQEIADRI